MIYIYTHTHTLADKLTFPPNGLSLACFCLKIVSDLHTRWPVNWTPCLSEEFSSVSVLTSSTILTKCTMVSWSLFFQLPSVHLFFFCSICVTSFSSLDSHSWLSDTYISTLRFSSSLTSLCFSWPSSCIWINPPFIETSCTESYFCHNALIYMFWIFQAICFFCCSWESMLFLSPSVSFHSVPLLTKYLTNMSNPKSAFWKEK